MIGGDQNDRGTDQDGSVSSVAGAPAPAPDGQLSDLSPPTAATAVRDEKLPSVQTQPSAPQATPQGTPPGEPEPAAATSQKSLKKWGLIGSGAAALLSVGYIGTAFAVQHSIPQTAAIGTVSVGGMSHEQALKEVARAADDLAGQPVELQAGDRTASFKSADAGLGISAEKSVAQLVGFTLNPKTLWGKVSGQAAVPFVTTADTTVLSKSVEEAAKTLNVAPTDGQITLDGTTPQVRQPVVGQTLQVAETVRLVEKNWVTASSPIKVAAQEAAPEIDQNDVEKALESFVKPALSGPVQFTVGSEKVSLQPADFASALKISPESGSLVGAVEATKLKQLLLEKNDNIGKEPKDAKIVMKDNAPTIIPSVSGVTIDETSLNEGFNAAIAAPERTASVTTTVAEPELTTAKAEALKITSLMARFDSKMPRNRVRTHNIKLAARGINGTILKPGETFSMNETLGRRTAAKGYKSAPVIMNGRLTKDYGGGISQVATTLFNGMFFAGLEEVQHKPHSFYISRYPEGREATVNYPTVDLKFKNDTPHGVLIETWVSEGAVHTRFWGQKQYDEIKSIKSSRSAVVPPKEIEDDSQKCVPQSPMPGFKVAVTRVFYKGGAEVKRETFRHRYIPEDKVTCTFGKKDKKDDNDKKDDKDKKDDNRQE